MMIYVMIPAYNEEANIERAVCNTVQRLTAVDHEFAIFVIDDGSRDRTKEIVKRLGEADKRVNIVSHPVNLGVGQVFRTGFTKIMSLASDDDLIITKEADNTSDVGILPAMLEKLTEGADVVLASCYCPDGQIVGTTALRVLYSSVANWLVRFLFRMRDLYTFSSFYRIYRVKVLRRVREEYGERLIDSAGFSCMVELLVRIHRLGEFKIREVPMVLRGDARIGVSKMKIINTIMGYLALFFRELGRGKKNRSQDV